MMDHEERKDSQSKLQGARQMIRKEVVMGPARLLLGDCLEILPTLPKHDAVVTDPPYGLGDWNNRGTNAARPFDSDITQTWDQAVGPDVIALMLKISPGAMI